MIVTCPCGFQLKGLGALNAHCPKCRRWLGDDPEVEHSDIMTATKPPCIHRGGRVGVLECQCGAIYQCELLGKFCSSKKPFDDLVMGVIQGVEDHVWLTDDNYQPCETCASMTPPEEQPVISQASDG